MWSIHKHFVDTRGISKRHKTKTTEILKKIRKIRIVRKWNNVKHAHFGRQKQYQCRTLSVFFKEKQSTESILILTSSSIRNKNSKCKLFFIWMQSCMTRTKENCFIFWENKIGRGKNVKWSNWNANSALYWTFSLVFVFCSLVKLTKQTFITMKQLTTSKKKSTEHYRENCEKRGNNFCWYRPEI